MSSSPQGLIPQDSVPLQNDGLPSLQPPFDQDPDTAKTLIIIAMVAQLIITLVTILVQLIITLVGILSFPYILGFIWLILDYFILYKPLAEEVAADVEKPCLLLGIVQTILGGIIPGVLLIIAYVKLRD
jgi:hypothetical protein